MIAQHAGTVSTMRSGRILIGLERLGSLNLKPTPRESGRRCPYLRAMTAESRPSKNVWRNSSGKAASEGRLSTAGLSR